MSNEVKFDGMPNNLEQFAHAYLVEGSDQIALFSQAELLAKTLLCSVNFQQNDSQLGRINTPCGACHSCQLFEAKNHPDYLLTQAEKSSIGIDDVRQISSFLTKTSQLSGNQVVVVDHAHLMTENASNALLKTLEEPTDKSYLLLLSDSRSNFLPTILSRCQILTLESLSKDELKQKYSELPDYLLGFGYKSESDILRWIESEKLAAFDQVYQLFIGWLKRQTPASSLANEVNNDAELHDFLIYLLTRRLRQLMLKATNIERNTKANDILIRYVKAHREIVGMNKTLAMNALLTQLTDTL